MHFTSREFWECYHDLPKPVRDLADKCFALLKSDPRHPSLHFKKIESVWSARVGRNYRALATEVSTGLVWFWIGSHEEYEELLEKLI